MNFHVLVSPLDQSLIIHLCYYIYIYIYADAFFNRNRAGACEGRWADPRSLAGGIGGCRIVWAEVGSLQC